MADIVQQDQASARKALLAPFKNVKFTQKGRVMLNYTFRETVGEAIERFWNGQNKRIWKNAKLKKFTKRVAQNIKNDALALAAADGSDKIDRKHIVKAAVSGMRKWKKKCKVKKWIDEMAAGASGGGQPFGPLCDPFLDSPPAA